MCLQGIMVAVFIILVGIFYFDEYNYHDSQRVRSVICRLHMITSHHHLIS